MAEWIEKEIKLDDLEMTCIKCGNPILWMDVKCKKCNHKIIKGLIIWFPFSIAFFPLFAIVSIIYFILGLPEIVFRGISRYIIGILPEVLTGLIRELFIPFIWMIFVSPYPRKARVFCNRGLPRQSKLNIRPKYWKNSEFKFNKIIAEEFQNQWSIIFQSSHIKNRAFLLKINPLNTSHENKKHSDKS